MTINEHEDLQFDNEQDSHVSSKSYDVMALIWIS